MSQEKHNIVVKGKKYGYWTTDGIFNSHHVRSEDNPLKTPYLKVGSKRHSEVVAAISAQINQ